LEEARMRGRLVRRGIKGTVTVIQRRAKQNSACVVNYGHCPFNSSL
jgi:hypothetical protein